MSLSDTIFILIGALVLFGPKKLPELARQLGKIMGELRRASNEFKFQMEEELRSSEESARRDAATTAHATPPPQLTIQPPATGEPIANYVSPRALDSATSETPTREPFTDMETAAPIPQTVTVEALPRTDPLPSPAEQIQAEAQAEAAPHA